MKKFKKKKKNPYRLSEPEKINYKRTKVSEFIPDLWYIIFTSNNEIVRIVQFDHETNKQFWFNVFNNKNYLKRIPINVPDQIFYGPFYSQLEALLFAHSTFPGVTLSNFKSSGNKVVVTHSILGTNKIVDSYTTRF